MNDALSDIFRLIRLKSCVYFQRDFHAPWAMRIEGTGFAQFHAVTRGNCVVELADRRIACSVGDVLLFPHGDAHVLADRAGREAVPGPEAMASFAGPEPLFAKGEVSTRVICGHYEHCTAPAHPLIGDLPSAIHVRSLDLLPGGSSALPLLMSEAASPSAGSTAVIERYAEILLIQILRAHAAQNPATPAFMYGLTDPRLARAISRIHGDFASPLGLDDLAGEAALSRSAFAQRFKDMTGIAPIEYLAKWRMLTAVDLLKATDLPLPQISENVGYESDISFARAFKREFGVTPARYRRTR